MSEASEQGRAYCEAQPGLLVAAVWHEALKFYPSRLEQIDFVNGYISERRKLDEQRREAEELAPISGADGI